MRADSSMPPLETTEPALFFDFCTDLAVKFFAVRLKTFEIRPRTIAAALGNWAQRRIIERARRLVRPQHPMCEV
jgi:hypothetical protein